MEKKKMVTGLMLITSHRHKNYLESELAANCLEIYPAQHRILMNINMMPGISQKELAKILQVSPATITISVKKLIKAGYIIKTNSDEDNRRNILTITDKGKEVVSKSDIIFNTIDREMYEGFSDEEMDILTGYLERIISNINRLHPQGNNCECIPCPLENDILEEQEEE